MVLAAGEAEVTIAFSLAKRLPDFNVTNSAGFSSVRFLGFKEPFFIWFWVASGVQRKYWPSEPRTPNHSPADATVTNSAMFCSVILLLFLIASSLELSDAKVYEP